MQSKVTKNQCETVYVCNIDGYLNEGGRCDFAKPIFEGGHWCKFYKKDRCACVKAKNAAVKKPKAKICKNS